MIREQTKRPRSQTQRQLLEPRLFALALVAACALLMCLGARLATTRAAARAPQRPGPQRRPSARTQKPNPQIVYWTNFKHERKEHADNCVACHVTNTKPAMTFERPEIEAYPYHPACIECHAKQRKDFYRGPFIGNAPAICADCHVGLTPDPIKARRALFEFPNPQRAEQFNDLFPHGTHQSDHALEQFSKLKIEKPKAGAPFSCLYCHQLDPPQDEKQTPKQGTAILVKAGTYYDTYTDHANCFQCHWSKEKQGPDQLVYKDDCSSCHDSVAHPAKTPPPGDKNPRAWTAPPPSEAPATVAAAHTATSQTGDWPARVSPMFMHASSSHDRTSDKEDGCASCHISLGRKRKLSLAQLDLKANQVPIVAWQKQDNKSQVLSCAACHNKLRGTGDDAKLYNELKGRADFYKQPEDKRAGQLFNCSYCHAPDLGTKQQVPCSHYWAFLNKDTGKLPPGVKNLLTEAYLKSLPDKVSSEHQCKDELTAAFNAK